MDFDQTWQETSTQRPLSSLHALGRSVDKDCLWLAGIFSDFSSASIQSIFTKLDNTQVSNVLDPIFAK